MTVLRKWHRYFTCLLLLSFIASFYFLSLSKKSPLVPPIQASLEQKRGNVQKDLYRYENGQRLHSRISAATSILKPLASTHQFIEEMEHSEAIIQSKFEGDTQEIRTFSSNKGIYNYASHTFQADSVLLRFYREPGHLFPEHLDPSKAFLDGVAEHVTLVIDSTPDFKAEKFQANIKIP
jgi:hypothetical protein